MSEQHVLIMRTPVDGPKGRVWETTVLARGSWHDMQDRWVVADKRIRALKLDGSYVAVRNADDPDIRALPVTTGPLGQPRTFNRVDALLALMPGDRVKVHIYGNHYWGTVIKATNKSATVSFKASTRKGGWGGEPAERERPFPIWGSVRWLIEVTEQAQVVA